MPAACGALPACRTAVLRSGGKSKVSVITVVRVAGEGDAQPTRHVDEEVLARVIQLWREVVADGRLSLDDFEVAMDRAMVATTEEELGNLVREFAPPVQITPAGRRLPELVEIETSGMFADVKRRGRWQVPRKLRVPTGPSRVTLNLTEAEFDAWNVELGFSEIQRDA